MRHEGNAAAADGNPPPDFHAVPCKSKKRTTAKKHSAASRNYRGDERWKSREKRQGNVCQGNNPENTFSHSIDHHSPDFAWDNESSSLSVKSPDSESGWLNSFGFGCPRWVFCAFLRKKS
jgi:hypothetical protein